MLICLILIKVIILSWVKNKKKYEKIKTKKVTDIYSKFKIKIMISKSMHRGPFINNYIIFFIIIIKLFFNN